MSEKFGIALFPLQIILIRYFLTCLIIDLSTTLGRLRYQALYYSQAVPALLRQQRITFKRDLRTEFRFKLTPKLRQEYASLFGSSEHSVPYTYHWPCSVLAFLDTMNRMGVAYKNILHLTFSQKVRRDDPFKSDGVYFVTTSFDRLRPYSQDKLVFEGKTTVSDGNGVVLTNKNRILVKNVTPGDWKKLGMEPDSKLKTKLQKQFALTDEISQSSELFFPPSMGQNFGKISGDLNPVHLSPLLARFFGYSQPFLQGLGTANALIAQLANLHKSPRHIKILFTQPVLLGKKMTFKISSDFISLQCSNGKDLVVGHYD